MNICCMQSSVCMSACSGALLTTVYGDDGPVRLCEGSKSG